MKIKLFPWTKMHSSRMRTFVAIPGYVFGVWCRCLQGCEGVFHGSARVFLGRRTRACENITLPQLRLWAAKTEHVQILTYKV